MVGAALFGGACTTVRVTDPARTATEQFLLSEAAAEAVTQLNFDALRGRTIFLDTTYFAALEKDFVVGELRGTMLTAGLPLVDAKDKADIIVEVRSSGVGIDRYGVLVGLPPIPVPTNALGGPVASVITPEIAFVKNLKQYGFASIAYVAYWRDTGEVVAASGPFVGRAYREDWWYFGVGPSSVGDITPVKKAVD